MQNKIIETKNLCILSCSCLFFCWFIVLQLFMFHFLSYQAFVRGVCVPDVGVVWPCQDKTRSASIGPQSKTKKGLRIGDPWPFPWEQGASFRLSLSSATRVNSYVETSKIRTADWWSHPSTWECKSDQCGAAKWPRDVPEGFERWNGISTTQVGQSVKTNANQSKVS